MIAQVVSAAHRASKTVSVCGEMAADPDGCLALAALQVDSLSVPVSLLASVRQHLGRANPQRLRELAPQLLCQRTAAGVRELLRQKG